MPSFLRREFPRGAIPIYLLMFLMTTTEGTAQLLLPPYLDGYGYALPVIGSLVSLLSVTRLASRLPVGASYSAARAKRMALAGCVGLSIATGGFAIADGRLVPVLAFTLLHGFAFGSLGTILLAAIIDLTGGHRAGSVMAWYTAALSTGYSVGAFAGGAIADTYGLVTAFLAASTLPLVGVLVVLSLPQFHGPPPVEGPAAAGGLPGLRSGIAQLDPRVWLAFAIVLYVNLISDAIDAFIPIYGLAVGLTLAEVGVLKGLKSAAATAIRFASLALFRWVQPAAANVWGVVVMGAATLLLPMVSGLGAFAALFVVLGLCRGLLRVTTAASVAELRREGRGVGIASGVYNAGLDVGAIVGPAAGGVIANLVGIPLMFQIMAVASVALYFGVALSTSAGRASIAFRPRIGRA